MYVVAGVSGNTGSIVASTLLEQQKPVRVIVRSEAKGAQWKAQGAEVAVASLDDSSALERILDGVEGFYFLIPPDLRADDPIGRARQFVDVLFGVLTKTDVPHVAYLSSIGAHQGAGTGPILTHFYGERTLRPLPTAFTFIRAGYFMENTAQMLPIMKDKGVLPSFFDPERKIPMVATKDIGEVAARALIDPPRETQIFELAGPAECSLTDAAQAYSRAMGKQIAATFVPNEGIAPLLTQAGISASVAELYREMAVGIEKGIVTYEGGPAKFVRGTVALDAFVKHLLAG